MFLISPGSPSLLPNQGLAGVHRLSLRWVIQTAVNPAVPASPAVFGNVSTWILQPCNLNRTVRMRSLTSMNADSCPICVGPSGKAAAQVRGETVIVSEIVARVVSSFDASLFFGLIADITIGFSLLCASLFGPGRFEVPLLPSTRIERGEGWGMVHDCDPTTNVKSVHPQIVPHKETIWSRNWNINKIWMAISTLFFHIYIYTYSKKKKKLLLSFYVKLLYLYWKINEEFVQFFFIKVLEARGGSSVLCQADVLYVLTPSNSIFFLPLFFFEI